MYTRMANAFIQFIAILVYILYNELLLTCANDMLTHYTGCIREWQ